MIQTENPGIALTVEQRRLVEERASLLAPAQAFWLSGYFNGLDAGLRSPPPQPASSNAAGHRALTVLYGTETGNAAELAGNLAALAKAKGLACNLVDMAAYKVRQLSEGQDLLIILSTYGEGDPPQPAIGFFEFIESRKAPRLEGTRSAVLALGDSTYEYYCQAGKRLDQRFEELGARRLAPRVDCDVDFEEPALTWIGSIAEQLANNVPLAPAPVKPATLRSSAASPSAYGKRNPFLAPIVENTAIVGLGSSKETRHIEFSLADLSIGEALTHRFEITAATPRFLDYWWMLSEADALRQPQEKDRAGERSVFLRTHHIIDIVRLSRRKPMPGYVLIVDFFGLVLAIIGFNMAFRQNAVRRYLGRPLRTPARLREQNDNEDPLTYVLRIAGVMVMIFGIVIGGMVTLVNLA